MPAYNPACIMPWQCLQPQSEQQSTAALLSLADTRDITYIFERELEPGSVYVRPGPLQPKKLKRLEGLLPPCCMAIVSMTRGSVTKVRTLALC
jgi:hypothetical protein